MGEISGTLSDDFRSLGGKMKINAAPWAGPGPGI